MSTTATGGRTANDPDEATEIVEAAAMFDLLLTQASRGVWRRAFPVRSALAAARSVAANPVKAVQGSGRVAADLAGILARRSDRVPRKGDRRFTDPAWTQNPSLHRLMQTYLALSEAARTAVDELDLDARDRHQLNFAIDLACDALAPSNSVVNPLFWKALIDTGGSSVVKGARNLVRDLATSPRVPTMVDADAFRVGQTVAATPGAVVLRTEQFELLQYQPTTSRVNRTPLLLVPALINKYYLADLAPGRSLVEYLVAGGQQVFVVSWRNPDVRHRDWGMDTYAAALDAAVGATRAITRAARVHLFSLCSGAALSAMWAATQESQQDVLASFSMGVAVLDQGDESQINALADPAAAKLAVRASSARGYLDGASLAETFAWLRPNDLIWNYWVNNYLQGKKPPAFDILYWNADTTRMTAQLHSDFIDLFSANQLPEAGAATLRGAPVDLSTIEVDSYVLAGEADHLSAWQSCYRSARLLGGSPRFVLSSSGHVACIVNPPGNPKASFRVSDADLSAQEPQQWQQDAERRPGTWWVDYLAWLTERNDGQRRAPAKLGNAGHPVLDDAPGTYVFDQ